jgi:FlgD Ig-like domain
MRLAILTVTLLVLMAGSAFAGMITGVVVTPDGAGVAGADIYLIGGDYGREPVARTGDDATFTIERVGNGWFGIRAVFGDRFGESRVEVRGDAITRVRLVLGVRDGGDDRDPGHDDRCDCFNFVYPINYLMPDETIITIEHGRDWDALKLWYREHPDVREDAVLQYPVEIIFRDGTTIVVNSDEEMRRVKARCGGGDDRPGDDDRGDKDKLRDGKDKYRDKHKRRMHFRPNPFNSTVQIEMTLPESGHLTMRVFNVIGQEIATIANSGMTAGTHTLSWDSLNDSGASVPSGIYFVHATVPGSLTEIQKVVLIR